MSQQLRFRAGRGAAYCLLPHALLLERGCRPPILATYATLQCAITEAAGANARLSLTRLARRAHLSPEALRRALQWLLERGWIGRGSGGANTYLIHTCREPRDGPDETPIDGELIPAARSTLGRDGPRDSDPPGEPDPLAQPHPAREWARPYYEAWVGRFGGAPNVGLLRRRLEPLEARDGRERTIARWRQYVAGLDPRYFGARDPLPGLLARFGQTVAVYDDPDWHLSEGDRRDVERLLEGLR